MTVARTVADVLSEHVTFEIESIDRMYLNLYQPRLQYGAGIAGFFVHHRGFKYPSSVLMQPITDAFVADIDRYVKAHGLDLVHFKKGERKDDVAHRYLSAAAGPDGTVPEGILFVGRAQEKTWVFRTQQRRNPVTGASYVWLVRDTAMINHFYFYGYDDDFGPFFLKFGSYFPYTGRICLNGNEWAKRQATKEGVGFTALDNGFAAVDDAAVVQEICDRLGAQQIESFTVKWLDRLPCAFTRADVDAGYSYQLSVLQAEFSLTQMLDRPLSGRVFFEQMIHDNLDIGRPDKVTLIFGRRIHTGRRRNTQTRCRTRVISTDVVPSVHIEYKTATIKQYHKEGRAIRTETTINNPADFGLGKRLSNLPALRRVGFHANRRLLDVQRISHDPAEGATTLAAVNDPVISTTGTRIAGLRITDARVQSLLAALCIFRLLPNGFTNRDLRSALAPLRGQQPDDVRRGQTTYDLRRLRAHHMIERIPHTHRYRVTDDGIRRSLFLTRLHQHFLIPGIAQVTGSSPPMDTRLRAVSRAYETAIDELANNTGLAA